VFVLFPFSLFIIISHPIPPHENPPVSLCVLFSLLLHFRHRSSFSYSIIVDQASPLPENVFFLPLHKLPLTGSSFSSNWASPIFIGYFLAGLLRDYQNIQSSPSIALPILGTFPPPRVNEMFRTQGCHVISACPYLLQEYYSRNKRNDSYALLLLYPRNCSTNAAEIRQGM
jgi:hypothetical protein